MLLLKNGFGGYRVVFIVLPRRLSLLNSLIEKEIFLSTCYIMGHLVGIKGKNKDEKNNIYSLEELQTY